MLDAMLQYSKLANTVLSFMIITLFGGSKFLCKMSPVYNLSVNFVYEQTNIILDSIKYAVGKMVARICDGNRANHLFKRIRNNWITGKPKKYFFMKVKQKQQNSQILKPCTTSKRTN